MRAGAREMLDVLGIRPCWMAGAIDALVEVQNR